jgi:cytidyltransferase-like protein
MKKKTIGLCHGVFDLVHYGHILHFKNAKSQVDELVVSLTKDSFVNKGSDRPYFKSTERLNFLKSIKFIDRVILSDSVSAIDSIKKIKPDIFFKGIEYKEEKVLNLFDEEKKYCKKKKIKIFYTDDKKFSSSKLLNDYFQFSPELKKNIKKIKKKYNFSSINEIIQKAKNKKIIVVGDPIMDNYKYINVIGTSSKSPSIAGLFQYEEFYKGGSIAVAEMLSHLGFEVNLITYISPANKLRNKINKKIKIINCFLSKEFPTIERVVDNGRGFAKLLQTYNIDKIKMDNKKEDLVINVLKKINKKIKLFLLIDFGFNFLTKKIAQNIDKNKINYSLNCHINSLNLTSNHYKKFKNFNFITFNKREFEINFREQIEFNKKIEVAKKIIKKPFAVTLGKKGSIFFKKNKEFFFPAINQNILDPVGCGDAFFSVSSVIYETTKDPVISNFLGNVYAGLHGMIVCNKSFVTEKEFLNSIKTVIS